LSAPRSRTSSVYAPSAGSTRLNSPFELVERSVPAGLYISTKGEYAPERAASRMVVWSPPVALKEKVSSCPGRFTWRRAVWPQVSDSGEQGLLGRWKARL